MGVRGAATAIAPEMEQILAGRLTVPAVHPASAIRRETVWVVMRDGVRLATDVLLPPGGGRLPTIAVRTPYGRAQQDFVPLAQRGYAVVAQDVRGTGDSEPDHWDFMVYELDDSIDFVEWLTRQEWFDGFVGSLGGSYVGWTQWCMAMHPAMSTITPTVAGFGVGGASRVPNKHMFVNAYSRSVGKGVGTAGVDSADLERQMLAVTLDGGYYNEPLYAPLPDGLLERYPELGGLAPVEARRRLWDHYRNLPPAERAELVKLGLGEDRLTFEDMGRWPALFPRHLGDSYLFPRDRDADLFQSLRAPALFITGWYDWGLGYKLDTWDLLAREAPETVRSRSRLLITPYAHNMPGYHEGMADHPELDRTHRQTVESVLPHWFAAVRDDTVDEWPTVTYYLMGANEWRAAEAWPPSDAHAVPLYLAAGGALTTEPPRTPSGGTPDAGPDSYVYDPADPTPTVGGSIVSYVYPPGSVDVSEVQQRPDVLTYTTAPLEHDVDAVGPLRLILYASSSAVDTDFAARLSDVFPDGRAIQLQNGVLRARYRNPDGEPALLEPGHAYRLEIDMSATANRFAAGHRIRLDISSADFPRFDRNTNLGGEPGDPVPATQTIYRDPGHRSHLVLPVIGSLLGDG